MTAIHQESFELRRVGGRIGAEVLGLELSATLGAQTVASLRQALNANKVLFFRNQGHLDDAKHEAFSRLLGEVFEHPTAPSENPSILELDSERGGRVNAWHTDVTFTVDFPRFTVLRGVTIPEAGGDTVWADTHSAYLDLPEPLRRLAETLWVEHTNEYDYARPLPDSIEARKEYNEAVLQSTVFRTEHPLVHVHPETQERHLLLGFLAKRILGVSANDSALLFRLLQDHIIRLENTVRWNWKQGDVVIWDNHATQHYAVDDYGSQKRVVRRVTIKGEAPLSVSGESSRSRAQEKRYEKPSYEAALALEKKAA